MAGTAVGLKKIDYDRMAQVGLMASTFFVASLVHVPIGPSSVHLILNGLVGLMLGWAAVPAIFRQVRYDDIRFGWCIQKGFDIVVPEYAVQRPDIQ